MGSLSHPNESRWILPPGMFRIALAVVVVADHSLPLKLGASAVSLFFVLSGYWVHVMWQSEYAKKDAPWRLFMISRLWRLLPVYLLSLALYIAVSYSISVPIPFEVSPSSFEKLHFYFSNLLIFGLGAIPEGYRILYPGWSLDIELQFYIIAPFIIGLAATRKSSSYIVALAAIAVAGAGYYLVCNEGFSGATGSIPLYLMFFLIGLGAARYNWHPSSRTAKISLGAAAAFFFSIVAFHNTRALFLGGPFVTPIIYYAPAANFVFALLLAPYAMATVRVTAKTGRHFAAAFDRYLSNLTYEVYLLHPSVITLFNYLMTGIPRLHQMVYLPIAYLSVVLLSCLVYRFYDQPIDKKRRDYVKMAARASQAFSKQIKPLQREPADVASR